MIFIRSGTIPWYDWFWISTSSRILVHGGLPEMADSLLSIVLRILVTLRKSFCDPLFSVRGLSNGWGGCSSSNTLCEQYLYHFCGYFCSTCPAGHRTVTILSRPVSLYGLCPLYEKTALDQYHIFLIISVMDIVQYVAAWGDVPKGSGSREFEIVHTEGQSCWHVLYRFRYLVPT